MNVLRIAFRNLGRSPARTALSIVSVAVSVMMVLLLKGSVDGIIGTMEESTIRLSSGHVRIIDREYQARERLLSLQYPVDGWSGEGVEEMLGDLQGLEGVAMVAPRLRFGGMVSYEDDLRSVMVVGGDPDVEKDLLRTDRYLAEGRFVQAGEREAVLGRRLLNRLDLEVGDRFTLVYSSSLGALKGYTFTIVGAFESGLTFLDDGTLFVPLDVAQQAVDLRGAVTELLVMANGLGDAPRVVDRINEGLTAHNADDRYLAIPWYEHNEIIEYLQYGRWIYDGIYVGLLILASFVVINTFVMIVNERRREIGMLSALGLRPREIRTLFLVEGALCGGVGSFVGTIVGAGLVWFMSTTGIPLPGAEAMGAELMYPTTLYPMFSLDVVIYAFVGGIAVTVAAVNIPARRAATLSPTEALRS